MFPLVSMPPSVIMLYVIVNTSLPLPGFPWSSTCAMKLVASLFALQVPEKSAVGGVIVTALTVTITPPTADFSGTCSARSEEHTSELQSRLHLVFRLLLEK